MQQILNNLVQQLLPVAGDEQQAIFESWLLLEKVTGKSRVALLAHKVRLTVDQQKQLESHVFDRVQKNKPLAYILGNVPFAGLSLIVRPPTLIPRPETEEMVLWIIEQFQDVAHEPLRVLDLCSGSGCIALALAAAFPTWQIIGVDISAEALALAEENRQVLGLGNVGFQQGSIFEDGSWLQSYDLIVSNPPYISKQSRHLVGADVLVWEDERALFADQEGWVFYERLAELAKQLTAHFLRDAAEAAPQDERVSSTAAHPEEGGKPVSKEMSGVLNNKKPNLVIEFGVDQQNMEQFLLDRGSASVEICCDSAGRRRWAWCRI